MTGLIRSFVFLLIAIFVAGTLALSAAPFKAEASVVMTTMPMVASGQDCKTCSPLMDMAASCDLTCGMSTAAVLAGPLDYTGVPANCRFELVDAIADGRAPSPACTPPRTTILI